VSIIDNCVYHIPSTSTLTAIEHHWVHCIADIA
jgi:hypothetical protein